MSKLQLYFDYYVEHHNPENSDWYQKINNGLTIMNALKKGIPGSDEFNTSENQEDLLENSFEQSTQKLDEKIDSIESLLDRFVFSQNNGMGNVQQGVVWDTDDNPHKQAVLNNGTSQLIYEILSIADKNTVSTKLNELLKCERDMPAVHNRFMRTLFPNDFGSPDAPNKLDRLLNVIKTKLGIEIIGGSILEKHQNLCTHIETDDPILRQMFTWDLFYMLDSEVSLKKAVCYYGAPGTGKTYRSSREAKKHIDAQRILIGKDVGGTYSIKTVQFHPSYSYEDFIEGIRPNNEGKLKLFNGSFKQFCKVNGEKEIQLYTETEFLSNKKFKEVDYDFARITINQLDQREKVALGLIHNDYAEGLTLQDAIEPAFFIIDEINRAELSKVFGELMYSLEYRGYAGKIKTQYSHLCETEEDSASFLWEDGENWFFIPQNIYIISTMNNIDRSVDAFDFALRRRFMWREVHPDYHVISQLLNKYGWRDYGKTIAKRLEGLNEMIESDDILDKNYRIGQSYVLELIKLNPDRFDTLNSAGKFIWDGFIAPLLEEYLKGLGNEQKSREKIEKFKIAFLK